MGKEVSVDVHQEEEAQKSNQRVAVDTFQYRDLYFDFLYSTEGAATEQTRAHKTCPSCAYQGALHTCCNLLLSAVICSRYVITAV